MADEEGSALDFEEAVARLDAYRRQIELGNRNLELLQSLYSDARRARQTLEGWKDEDDGAEVMVPVGANTYVRASVTKTDTALLGVGRGYSAERPTAEAISWLEKREKELNEEADRTSQRVFELRQDAAQLQEVLEQAAAQAQQRGGN